MSEIDEGLDEVFRHNSFNYDGRMRVMPESTWDEAKQAILDLMCKHRGCEPETAVLESTGEPYLEETIDGPCTHCGRETK